MPGTSRTCRGARAMCRTASGSATSTASACCAGVFARPTRIVALRAYLRHRQTLVESAGTYIQRMQKALVQMNLQLPLVVSDITGVTGPQNPARHRRRPATTRSSSPRHRDHRCRASQAEIVAALTGPLSARAPLRLATKSGALRRVSDPTRGLRSRHRGPRAGPDRHPGSPGRRRCPRPGSHRRSARQRPALRDPHAAASPHRRRRSHADRRHRVRTPR